MRHLTFILFLLFVLVSKAQVNTPKSNWEYGVHLHFNNSIIKSVSTDTFTNKSGVGLGLLLERTFDKFGVQFIPSFAQTRYSDDVSNRIATTSSTDVAINMIHPIDKGHQTFFTYGFMAGYAFQHTEKNLNGILFTNDIHNTLVTQKPLDFGAQIGFGLDLSQGSRLTVSYIDFFNGKQTSNRISGKIDYVQVGLQLRLRELSNSDKVGKKYLAQQEQIQRAHDQAKTLKTGNGGVMVFVIGKAKKSYIGSSSTWKDSTDQIIQEQNRTAILQAIRSYYKHGEYVVTTDSLFTERTSGSLTVLGKEQTLTYLISPNKKVFFAKIDELFIEENGNLKWGTFVFDQDMNLLQDPFPYYTPYRHLDKNFESANTMISEFNSRLRLISAD